MQVLQFSVFFFRLFHRLKSFQNKKLREKTPCLNCCHSRLLRLPKAYAETWRRKLNIEHLLLLGALYICDFNQPSERPSRVTVITPILQRADAQRGGTTRPGVRECRSSKPVRYSSTLKCLRCALPPSLFVLSQSKICCIQ